MFGWRKGKQEAVVEDTEEEDEQKDVETSESRTHKLLEQILVHVENMQDSIDSLEAKVNDIEGKITRISSPADKMHNDLVDAKAQIRASGEFMQGLIMQLITCTPMRAPEAPEAKVSPALANYLAKKSANGDAKPKLP